MKIKQDLISVNYTKASNRKIDWIVIHYFGSFGSDEAVVNYFDRSGVYASAHYTLDGDSITQAVLDKDIAWHCGDKGIGEYKKLCDNNNSIGIEVQPTKIYKSTMNASDPDWYFEPEVIDNLTWLVSELMVLHDIDADHVIRHYDVTGKLCPRPFVGRDLNSYYKRTGDQVWNDFKNELKGDNDVTQEEFNAKMDVYLEGLKKQEPSVWSAEVRAWAEENKLIAGDEKNNKQYKMLVTREQLMVFLKRIHDMK